MIPKDKTVLSGELATYLGELMHKFENTHHWIEKDIIHREINAVKHLLGIEYKDETFLTRAMKIIQDIQAE